MQQDVGLPVLLPSYLLFPWPPRGTAELYKDGREENSFGHVVGGIEKEMGGEMEEDMEMEDVIDEELDKEPLKGPEGTVTVMTVSSLNNGDWLAVVYDGHWWLAKSIAVDTEQQDVKVEFLHPHGPTAKYQPKLLTKDVCFCPVEDMIVKLMGNASPVQLRAREIYSIAPDVMDFIEHEHVRLLLLKA